MDTRHWQEHSGTSEGRIRTRGAVRTRGVLPMTRARGSVRTRGSVTAAAQPMTQLVADVRGKADGSPIAVVMHGWDGMPAQVFLRHLAVLLDADDAVWLVPTDPAQVTEPPAAWPDAVALDFSQEADVRTYANLVVDIVFFPGGTPEQVQQWDRRAEAVVINAAVTSSGKLIEHASQSVQEVYLWSPAEPNRLVGV